MPTYFHITPASTQVTLDARRHAKATFTVTNSSGFQMQARARVVAIEDHTRGWFQLAQDPEYDYQDGETTSYTVQINVPADAPAGKASFRLDVVGIKIPDEEYTEGPLVQIVVPEAAPEKKPFPWWILAVAGGVVAVVAILLIVLRPRTATLKALEPGVTTLGYAKGYVEGQGLKLRVEHEFDLGVEKDRVIDTSWQEGDKFTLGSEVTVIVSSGPEPVHVPSVQGETQIRAAAILTAAGLTVDDDLAQTDTTELEQGLVVGTIPEAETTVDVGSEVRLVVSSLVPCPGSVPDVSGMTADGAMAVLELSCYRAGAQQEEWSETIALGRVIRTEPGADMEAGRNARVALVLSQGSEYIFVPEVVGLTTSEAKDLIQKADLSVGSVNIKEIDPAPDEIVNVGPGRVMSSNPAEGTRLKRDAPVDLVVRKREGGIREWLGIIDRTTVLTQTLRVVDPQ